jgi:aminoglycoside phosphotransferase (APT) family kinase protein
MADGPRLLASGRDGDIFEHGPGTVLRRTRDGRSIEHEARVMRYAAAHGYPVPAVHEVRAGGAEIVMERVDGPLMMDVIARRPWTMPAHARLLAYLHDRLHRIRAPEGLRRVGTGAGDVLLHLDLHPMNVIMAARGPVVIDWGNAAAGEPLFDVAATYVLLTCPKMPGPRVVDAAMRPVRHVLAGVFARRYRGSAFTARLADAADLKALDRNMDAEEAQRCRRLAVRMRARAGGAAA